MFGIICKVVPYIGTWIETSVMSRLKDAGLSYLIQVRGLKQGAAYAKTLAEVVPYIGTWIETPRFVRLPSTIDVVPYIGTWIETLGSQAGLATCFGRTLYRYVD